MNGISRVDSAVIKQDDLIKKSSSDSKTTQADTTGQTDRITRSTVSPAVLTYSPAKAATKEKERSEADQKILSDALAQSERTVAQFKELVTGMLQNQAKRVSAKDRNLSGVNLANIGVPEAAAKEIERLTGIYGPVEWTGKVGDGDYWGVDATAQRIFDFAVSLSNGNQETLATLKDSITKAFKECEDLFGGTLPDISYRTYDKIESLFKEYEAPSSEKV